jgi:hypothetical protein
VWGHVRRRSTRFPGLGHPVVDALIAHFQGANVHGVVTALAQVSEDAPHSLSVRCIFTTDVGDGHPRKEYRDFRVTNDGGWDEAAPGTDLQTLISVGSGSVPNMVLAIPDEMRERIKSSIATIEVTIRAKSDGVANVRSRIVGLAVKDDNNTE